MKTKYDVISIGDPVIDSFLFVDDIEVKKIGKDLKAIINWGDKLPVQKFFKSVAGNASNNAIGSSRLGLKAAYFCIVGDDVGGREIKHRMAKEGVSTEYIHFDKTHGTNYHTVLSHEGERTIFVYHEHRKYHVPKFAPSKWVYLTSMPQGFQEIYPGLAKYLDSNKVKLAFNPGTYQLKAGIKVNKPMLERTDVLSVNVEEAQRWVGDCNRDPEELCIRLRKLGPKAIALTDGRRGAYSHSDEGFFYIPEFPGKRVEATGAGDSFTTAYVAALIYGKSHAEALQWGPVNAGSVVLFVGPLQGLLSRHQIEERLSKMPRFKAVPITDLKTKARILKLVAKKKD
ncbi:MAG: carbohydrate kinase family protein [Candidatus Doudnabacteria bacterium]|nr:carbohydrate kinase family protein [Candidatus Doudnabacteria bacterium]